MRSGSRPFVVCAVLVCVQTASIAQRIDEGKPLQAKMRVHATNTQNTFVTEWTTQHCVEKKNRRVAILGPKANAIADRGTGQRLGIPLLDGLAPKQTAEFVIPAGTAYVLNMRQPSIAGVFGSAVTYEWCSRTIGFVPEAEGFYEAVFSPAPDADPKRPCRIVLYRISPAADGAYTRTPEPAASEVKSACQQAGD